MRNFAYAQACLILLVAASLTSIAVAAPGALTQTDSGKIVAQEETSAIERTIENRARDILSGMISPDQFAVYVQVAIKADAQTLQQYYDEKAISGVPGIVLAEPVESSPANNKLYSLIENKKIMVVLDKGVTAEQELVAKEVLTSKLGIDPKGPDRVEFRRATVPAAADRQIAMEKGRSTAPAWMKWVLILLGASIVAAVAILLWQISLLRERVNSRAKLHADLKIEKDEKTTSAKTEKQVEASKEETEDKKEEATEAKGATPHLSAHELREKTLALIVTNPKACTQVVRRMFSDSKNLQTLAVACQAIGFEYCKQLFDTIGPSQWKKIGEYLKANLNTVTTTPVEPVLHTFYTDLLAESLGWDPAQNEDGPFDFLRKLSDAELKSLLVNEDPNNIALIAAFWEPGEVSKILEILPETSRKNTVLQMSRLSCLPAELVQQAALKFSEVLKALRSKQELNVNGSEVVARILDTVDSSVEDALLEHIEREAPETREKLRAYYFTFDSIPLVPEDVLSGVLEKVVADDITASLVGINETVQNYVLNLLPPKQRAIIEDDVKLAAAQKTIPPQKTATARKQMVQGIKKALLERGITLSSLLEAAKAKGLSVAANTGDAAADAGKDSADDTTAKAA